MKNLVTLNGRRRALACLLTTGLAMVLPATAATVTRGPYLQSGTPDSIIVRWRTSNATGGLVRYGTNVTSLASTATDGFTTNRHAVSITGLVPNTKYFYELGTGSEWFAGGTNQFFVTAPPVGTPKPTRLWVLGDSGDPGPEAYSVRDAYAAFARAAQRDADLFLMLGDNAYGSGTDTEYQAAVFETYPDMLRKTVLWPTIGNHDKDPAYFEIFSLPQNAEAGGVPSGTESYYSFDYANIHFVCLNSYRADRTTNGPMYQWLIADLQAHTADWLIAFWHHPPYTKGTHDSDVETELIEMRQRFVPLLESHGVDLVLSGHSHVYERTYFIDGHYGLTGTFTESMKKSPSDGRESGGGAYVKASGSEGNQGTVYTVAGNGAMASDPDPFPAVFSSSGEVGSLVIDISGNRLDLKHLEGSSNVTDFFTIIKEVATTNPPVAPTNLVATAVATNQIQLAWHDLSTNESSFRIERSTNGVNFTQVAVTPSNATNTTDLGLMAGTTYHYRVRARNQAGESDYSPVAQATTFTPPPPLPDTTPPGAITNLLVTAVTSNTVTLRWRAPGDDGYVGTAASYQLRFDTTAITESNWSNATPVAAVPAPLPGGTFQNFTVPGLSLQTLYFFALKTSDESNNVSPLSNLASGTTTAASNPPVLISTSGVVLIASNSVWKYLDDGSDQGAVWRSLALDDSTWASGPAQLGYGNFDDVTTVSFGLDLDNKFITTYFRRPFVVADPSLFSGLTARVRRDDGVVVYLNGTEVFRDNLTNAAINYLTRALVGVTGTNKTRFHSSPPIAAALLTPGTNLIAAEVHQRSATSSQMSFNLELVAALAPPFIRIAHTNGQVAIHWKTQPGQRYRVLRATELTPAAWTSPWGDITATNSVTAFNDPVGSGARFYRVMLVD